MKKNNIEMTLVSIIVPIYNTKAFFGKCYNSIHNQTYKNFELILVDDGSTDGVSEICDEIAAKEPNVHVIHKENGGVSSARNIGIQRAKGKYLLFVDSDDWIEKDMLEYMINHIGEADMLSVGVYREWTQTRQEVHCDKYEEGKWKAKDIIETMIYDFDKERLQPLTPWLVNKLFLTDKAKNIVMNENVSYAEDTIFVYKYLLSINSIKIVHKPFYHYVYREDSAIHKANHRILMNINYLYLDLKECFSNSNYAQVLMKQLEKFVTILTLRGLGSHIGFETKMRIIQFIGNFSELYNKKIVLYGAGKCGQDYTIQLEQFGYDVVLWVDKDAISYKKKGFAVNEVQEILNNEFDVVCIAVSDYYMAEQIKNNLIYMGIDDKKIFWSKPLRVF